MRSINQNSARSKIRTQIDDTQNNSKVADAEKLHIFERTQEKYANLKETLHPSKILMVVAGAVQDMSKVEAATAPMFEPLS